MSPEVTILCLGVTELVREGDLANWQALNLHRDASWRTII